MEKFEYTKLAEKIKKFSEIMNDQESNDEFKYFHSFQLKDSCSIKTEYFSDEELKENYFNFDFNSSFFEGLTFTHYNDYLSNFNYFLF